MSARIAPGGLAVDAAGNLAEMPSDLTHKLNDELLDVVTLIYAAREQSRGRLDDDDTMTSPSSRTAALLQMAEAKVRAVVMEMSPYV